MFRAIALGGGGVRAGLHIGALQALERVQGHLNFPDGIWGCSAGAVVATAVAFNLSSSQIASMYATHLQMSEILPRPRLDSLAELLSKKGLFAMDRYEEAVVAAFRSQGVELVGKTIADAPQPLYIVASNLTTHNPTVFTKQVGILDAIRCSSCIPFVFQPQVLYNHVYLDGGVLVDCVASIAPPEALTLHIADPGDTIYAKDIETISLQVYLYRIYRCLRGRPVGPNILWLQNATIGILQDMTLEEKQTLVRDGDSQTLAFLAKRFPDKLKDVSGRALPGEVNQE